MVEEQASGSGRSNKKFAAGTAAGVVAGAVVVAAALNLVQPRSGVTATPAPSTPVASVPAAPSPAPAAPTSTDAPSAAPSSAAPVTPAPSPSTTPSKSTPAPTSPSPSKVTTTTEAPAGEVVTSLPRLSYVAVFQWLPKSRYSAEDAAAMAAKNQKGGLRVVAIDGSLIQKPGNYGLGVTGLADFADASAACRTMGFSTTGKDCFRRAVMS